MKHPVKNEVARSSNEENLPPMELNELNINDPNDPTRQPAKRRNIRPEILKKLLKQVFENIFNPNAIGALYALFEKESFQITVTDIKNAFKATLYIDGLQFESVASQKKKARNDVATKALKHFYPDVLQQEPSNMMEFDPIQCNNISILNNLAFDIDCFVKECNDYILPDLSGDTTLEAIAKCDKLHDNFHCNGNVEKKVKKDFSDVKDPHLLPPKKKEIKSNILERVVKQALGIEECQNPNTITALYTLYERDSFLFEVIPADGTENKFVAHLHINGKTYSESASSIKKAKTGATIKALKELFPQIAYENNNIPCDTSDQQTQAAIQCDDIPPSQLNYNTIEPSSEERSKSSKCYSFCDFIASIIQSKYNSVVQSFADHLQRYSVLSGIVMIRDNDLSSATVICVCTGNKCLRGDHVSKDGNVLFDCHAEILSRRCLMLYLYTQINLSLSSNDNTILDLLDNGRYKVKTGVKFYLYISSSPCGDGRVFNFSPAKNPDRPKLAEKRGILRVKLESGMGGIPVTEYMDLNPTFEDYMKGQQMVLMCCSAKLMRSNVLGTQGALLSHFLEPVYFDGVLIGDIFHRGNLERALYRRVDYPVLESLPTPFKLNKPIIEGITNSKIVINVKPGKSCMNWIVCEPTAEFIKTKTGQTSEDSVSRLSKLNLFKQFLNIFVILKKIDLNKASTTSYLNYKEQSLIYQSAKNVFFEALKNNSKGQWIRKSKESDLFHIVKAESC